MWLRDTDTPKGEDTSRRYSVHQRPFFLGCKIGGVRIWQGVEIFPQHAVFIAQYAAFIAQQMLDQILKICKSFLKIGFF